MSSPEKQEVGRELQPLISQCSQSLAIPETDFVSQHPVCPDDQIVTLDPPSHKTALPEDAGSGRQLVTESPVIAQAPRGSSESLRPNSPKSKLPVDEITKAKSVDDTTLQAQECSSHKASGPHALEIAEEIRRPSISGTECTDTSDKIQEVHVRNGVQPNALVECSAGDTAAAVTTVSITDSPAEVTLMGCHISSTKPAQSNPRIENLPRLALLDLPFLGITPLNQDNSERRQTLGGIQDIPHSTAGAMRSSDEQDLHKTSQVARICQSPRQGLFPSPEASVLKVAVSGTSSAQGDDGADVDDEVTFIVSVPRRRKKKKRTELSANKLAEELVGRTNSVAMQEKNSESPGPRCSTPASTRCPSIHQPSPITDRQKATPVDASVGSLLPASPRTAPQIAQISQVSQGSLQFDDLGASGPVPKAAINVENSVPVLTGRAGAIDEAAPAKRKLVQSNGQENGIQENESPMKRAKIVNEQQGQDRSAVSPVNHGHKEISTSVIGCATTLKTPSATSLNMGSSSPGNSNLQLHGNDASNLVTPSLNSRNQTAGSSNGAVSPRSAQADDVRTPVIGCISVQTNMRDVRRKPSLYSIPVWSSTPISSCTTSSQITTAGASSITRTINPHSSAPVQIPVSQHAQRSTSNNSISSTASSQSPSSAQLRTGNSQAFFIPRSLDNQGRSAQPPGAQTVYAISAWPPNQRFLTAGQQVQQGFPSQSQHFTFTSQEWARIQAAKNSDSQQRNSGIAISPQMRRAESLPQTSSSQTASQTADQSQPPSPNLLVDIAQTCQAIFPFARIAERHNQPVKKVFDAFSAVIQIPLLQCAADRRRNGKLGTARLKKFREVSKAVNEQHEKERKAEKQGAKMRNELAEPPAKRPKGRPPKSAAAKGLLGMALANSQKNAGGSK